MGKKSRGKRARRDVYYLWEKVAPPILRKNFSADSCLNASRVCLDVLKHFGIKAEPITTKALVFNKAMWARVVAKGDLPDSPEELNAWCNGPDKAWSLGVAGPHEENKGEGWPWHLVVLSNGRLIDSSARQFNRPAKNIVVEDIIVIPYAEHVPGFAEGKGAIMVENKNGVTLSYLAVPENREFLFTPGFQSHPENVAVAKEIIRAIGERT